MRTPAMSMKAVIISTTSFPIFLVGSPAQRRWRTHPADDAGERDDGEQVRNHVDELRRDERATLELDLERLRRGEEEAGDGSPARVPAAKDSRRERNEAAARRHLRRELVLVEGEVDAAEARDCAREQ